MLGVVVRAASSCRTVKIAGVAGSATAADALKASIEAIILSLHAIYVVFHLGA